MLKIKQWKWKFKSYEFNIFEFPGKKPERKSPYLICELNMLNVGFS